MTGVIMTLLVVFGLFFGMYQYVSYNLNSAGVTIDPDYSQSYADLNTSMDDLEANVNQITNTARNISQADYNVALVAWNGAVGIVQTIGLFFNVFDVAINVFNAIFPPLAILPNWIKVLIEIGIISIIVLVILGLVKGEQKT